MEDQTLTVGPEHAGMRLDRFLVATLSGVSRSHVQRAIRLSLVSVDGVTACKTGLCVREGQEVEYAPAPVEPLNAEPQDIFLDILYEDEYLIVVNKAAGMVVHPAAGNPDGTLVNALLHRYPEMQKGGGVRPGIVHRLDRGTSGVLAVARNDRAREALASQFLDRTVFKGYLALTLGTPNAVEGRIDRPIERHRNDRKKFTSRSGEGRQSTTLWRTVTANKDFALLAIRILTGRTHQVRVHLADNDCPVLADDLYGPRWTRKITRPDLLENLTRGALLHAGLLGITHPHTGLPVWVSAPPPAHFACTATALLAPQDRLWPEILTPDYFPEVGNG